MSVMGVDKDEEMEENLLLNLMVVVFFRFVFGVELWKVNLEPSHRACVSIGIQPDAVGILPAN